MTNEQLAILSLAMLVLIMSYVNYLHQARIKQLEDENQQLYQALDVYEHVDD